VGMMSLRLGKLADPLHEGEGFAKVAESKCALDAAGIIAQPPTGRPLLEPKPLIGTQRRNAPPPGGARPCRERLGHGAASYPAHPRRQRSARSRRTRCGASR